MCIILFIIWILITISKLLKWNHRKNNCTLKVNAIVTNILERKPVRGTGMIYKPIFKVISNNENIIINSAKYSNLIQLHNGESVELLLNPNNTNEFLYVNNKYNVGKTADIMGCAIWFIVIIGLAFLK